jgi:hypothetical protein
MIPQFSQTTVPYGAILLVDVNKQKNLPSRLKVMTIPEAFLKINVAFPRIRSNWCNWCIAAVI